jgi:glycogen operon protein
MQPEDWESGFGRAVGVFLNGDGIRERDRRGEEIVDRHFFILFNAGDEGSRSRSRARSSARSGRSSSTPRASSPTPSRAAAASRRAGGRSLIVLRDYRRRSPTSTTPSPRRSRR